MSGQVLSLSRILRISPVIKCTDNDRNLHDGSKQTNLQVHGAGVICHRPANIPPVL